jgi:hypothetical protein
VTWKLLYAAPICCTREKACELIGPPNVSIAPKPASSMIARSTLGAPSGAFGPGIIDQSAIESLRVRPAVPPNVRSGIGSALRSCRNLPIAFASSTLSARIPSLSVCATDFAGDPGSACSIASRCSSSNTVITPAVPAGSFSASSSMPALTLRSVNFPISPPTAPPTAMAPRSGGANRPTTRPVPAPHPRPLRPKWSPCCTTVISPSASWVTRIAPSISIDLAPTLCEGVEVSGRGVHVRIGGDEDIGQVISHRVLLLWIMSSS